MDLTTLKNKVEKKYNIIKGDKNVKREKSKLSFQ